MPRPVDHEKRRNEIIEATLDVLAENGTRGLSFRAVASKLGGSTTLITHYYPTQEALLDTVASTALDRWAVEIGELDSQSEDPRERFRELLIWLVPSTERGLRDERSRINLVAGSILGNSHKEMFETWDQVIRSFLRSHLEGLLPAARLETAVEMCRVMTNGVTLLAVENPDAWSEKRQLAVVDELLSMLGLASD